MRIIQRPIEPKEKPLILEFHCRINYESDSPWAREVSYDQYRETWFSTSQPEEFYAALEFSLHDHRTIAELWFDENEECIGYCWVTFSDVPDYGLVIAEVRDILVTPKFQQQGIGSQMLSEIEQRAREHGARLLRSGTGTENVASHKLHESCGFRTYRVEYEKVLDRRDR